MLLGGILQDFHAIAFTVDEGILEELVRRDQVVGLRAARDVDHGGLRKTQKGV
jgi:hypothetical protein